MNHAHPIPSFMRSPRGFVLVALAAAALAGCRLEQAGDAGVRAAASPTRVGSAAAPIQAPAAKEPVTLESTVQLAPDVLETPFTPEIASNAAGDAVAVWEQFDGQRYSIWGNSHRAGVDWGRATVIHAPRGDGAGYNPQLALSNTGRAIAVWVQADHQAGSYQIWSSRFEPAGGWGPAAPLQHAVDGPAYAPQVAIDNFGNATAVWQQSDGRRFNIWGSRFATGAGWARPVRLQTGNVDLGAPQVTLDPLGNALAIWPQFRGQGSELWATRSAAMATPDESTPTAMANVWGKPVKIESVRGYAHSPHIVSVAPGHATVVWEQVDGHQTRVLANHYRLDKGWRQASHRCTGDDAVGRSAATVAASQGLKTASAEKRGKC